MLNKTLKAGITLIACNALAFAPLLRAEQLSLPSGDLIAPVTTNVNSQCSRTWQLKPY